MIAAHKKRGLTFIEILIAVAIIGILSSVVVLRAGNSRTKARDARRVADITQLQAGLEAYFATNTKYPATLSALAPAYVSNDLLKDKLGNVYAYAVAGDQKSYCLGAWLELANPQLVSSNCTVATPTGQPSAGYTINYKVSR